MNLKAHRRFITIMILSLSFFISFLALLVTNDKLIHKNGLKALSEIVVAMFKADLSWEIVTLALEAVIQTITYAAVGISIAIIVGFVLSIPSSQIFNNDKNRVNIAKHTLAFMRGIHELIWALFFVASIGLSPFSAVLAIAIPYAGTLGKIFSDIIRSTPNKPIASLKKSGASNFQILIYAIIPLNFNQLKSYMFYRFECAIRSSAILSFIGLGGLGYQIHISLQDLKYNEVWTFVYMLVIAVLAIDYIGKLSRNDKSKKKKTIANSILSLIMIFSWYYIIFIEKLSLSRVFNQRNFNYSIEFLKGLLAIGEKSAPYLDMHIWLEISRLALDTIWMSIIAIGIACLLMLITITFATNTFISDRYKFVKRIIYHITNATYIFTRTVPELIWAVMLVFIFKPGILPGAIALGIHNFGILGKLCAELIEDFDRKSIVALHKSGASKFQAFVYGTLAELFPRFISYIMYRFEVIVRSSIVVGVVGAGGLGEIFKLSMSYFHYGKVGMIIITYLFLVAISDLISVKLQELNS